MPDASFPHDPPEVMPPGPPLTIDSPESGGARLHHLFRHSLASGLVNPLLYLVALYRARAPT